MAHGATDFPAVKAPAAESAKGTPGGGRLTGLLQKKPDTKNGDN
jgi:hypothetical protein